MSMIGNYKRLKSRELEDLRKKPERLSDFLFDEDTSENQLDIDKTWHVIHFLLNGETWEGNHPYFNAVLGGKDISDEDVGYGTARYLTSIEVEEVANAISVISAENLLKRFNPEKIKEADIYPDGWNNSDEDLKYISDYYKELQQFFRKAADEDEAMVMWLS